MNKEMRNRHFGVNRHAVFPDIIKGPNFVRVNSMFQFEKIPEPINMTFSQPLNAIN